MQIMWIKLIICSLLSAAECGSHSLEFLSTGRVQPGDRPPFEQLTVFDGVPISYCDSLTTREKLKPCLQSEDLLENCGEAVHQVLQLVHDIQQLSNNTVYVVQRRRGCIRSANGDVSAFEAWAVNGMDFISFDPESKIWTSHSPSAVQVQLRWHKNNKRNFDFARFITKRCPEIIQKTELRPTHQNTELRVFAKPTANTDEALLRCHVTTTDKSVSSVHLIGDGASKAIWITVTGPVPSEDGSVILRLTAGISLRENTNKYGCRVQTGGHNFSVFWDGNTLDGRHLLDTFSWRTLSIILFICCILFILGLISCGIIYLHKCVKRSHSGVDPEQMEQFTMMILSSYTSCAERQQEWINWMNRISSEEQHIYDPEHYANQIEGPLR